MNIDGYLRRVTPTSILDVLDARVLQSLLDGYSFALESGITVLFPDGEHVVGAHIDRRNALDRRAVRSFCQVCAFWREQSGCNMETGCVEADKEVAQKFFN